MKNPSAFTPKNRTGGRDLLRGHDIGYIYRGLWRYLSHDKWTLLIAIFLTVVSGVLSITGTSLAASAIGAIAGENAGNVYFYLLLMIVFYVFSSGISYLLSVVMLKLSQRISAKMREDIYRKLVTLPVGFFDRHQAGEIVSTVTYDVNTIGESLSSDFLQIISSFATVVYSFILMITVSVRLMIVFFVTIPLSILLTHIIAKVTRPLFRRRSAALAEMNGYAEEMIAGQKVIRTYAAEAAVAEGFEQKNLAASDAYIRAEANGTMGGPTVNFVNNLSMTLVNIFGAVLYMTGGGLSLEGLSRFVLLSRKFSGPINQIANIYADIQSALAAAERVFRLIDETPEPEDSADARLLSSPQGEIRFSRVRFGYDPTRPVLKDLSFVAPRGSVTAIVGPTGAGKTTIIQLLMRFYDIDAGNIFIDGEDIRSFTRDSLRAAYTMVLQETWLFHGTVFENVAYGKEGVTREQVESVCRAAKIHSYIESLPDGYDTVISEGDSISKGQKQLLTIARAMLTDSPILILDEATSNVDSATEKDISDAMIALMHGRTCFVIAHRLATVRDADRILVVRDGDVAEQGTHEELLEKHGFYSELYYAQFDPA